MACVQQCQKLIIAEFRHFRATCHFQNLGINYYFSIDDCSGENAHKRTWKSSKSAQPDKNRILQEEKTP